MSRDDNKVGIIGVFDLCHEGHINLIKKASILGRVYIGVVCDKAVRNKKGIGRPVFNEQHRLALVKNMKGVADAFITKDFNIAEVYDKYSYPNNLENINILLRGEDQDHIKGFDKFDDYKGLIVLSIGRTKNISTTELIKKTGDK